MVMTLRYADKTLRANISYFFSLLKLIGNRGENTQSTMHGIHKSGVMFFAEINKNAVSCWNSKSALRPANMDRVDQDNVTMIYPSDLNVSSRQTRSKQDTGRKEIENNSFLFSLSIYA